MNNQLLNTAGATGTYNDIETSLTSNENIVNLITGLSMTLTADKQNWADGILTYTIIINNQATETYITPVIIDVIDIALVDFVNNSVKIDGVTATAEQYNYNDTTGTLTVNLESITTTTNRTVTFQITKKV